MTIGSLNVLNGSIAFVLGPAIISLLAVPPGLRLGIIAIFHPDAAATSQWARTLGEIGNSGE